MNGAKLQASSLLAAYTGVFNHGIGREIHNAFNNFNSEKEEFLTLINQPDNPEIYNKDHIYSYITETFTDNINQLFPGEEQKKRGFNEIFNKMNGYIAEEHIELIGKSIAFAFSQNDDFKKEYIISFLDETCNAYTGGRDNTSCVKGIIERFALCVGSAVKILCTEKCDNEVYRKLDKLMNPIFVKSVMAKTAEEWYTKANEDEDIKSMDKTKRKANFIEFLVERAKSFDEDNAKTKSEILKLANDLDYTFEDLQLGGNISKKVRKTRKSKKTKKVRKTRQIKKSK